jgi:hypothetical protein
MYIISNKTKYYDIWVQILGKIFPYRLHAKSIWQEKGRILMTMTPILFPINERLQEKPERSKYIYRCCCVQE